MTPTASPTLSDEKIMLAVNGPSLGGELALSANSRPAFVAPAHSIPSPPDSPVGAVLKAEPNVPTVSPSATTLMAPDPVAIDVPVCPSALSLLIGFVQALGVL